MVNYANELSGKWLEILRGTLLPKTGVQEKQLLQDPGYVEGVETTCCMLHAILQGCMKYPMSKELKEIKITIIKLIYDIYL